MADVSESLTGMKTITASTRVDIDTPIINLKASVIIDSKGTWATGTVLSNLKNSTPSALSWTQKDIEISIGWTPYYFTVYPTKA